MSHKGDGWDNAVAESFFHTLNTELTHQCKFKSREEAKNVIFEYIEVFITVSGFIRLMIIYHRQNLKH
jgi:transposase InsO family protein